MQQQRANQVVTKKGGYGKNRNPLEFAGAETRN